MGNPKQDKRDYLGWIIDEDLDAYEDDYDDELDEDEEQDEDIDEEAREYTVQEQKARKERELDKTRAQLAQRVIDDIYTKNRAILALGGKMLDTPGADKFCDEPRLTKTQYDEAMQKLPSERTAVEKALKQEQETKPGKDRAADIAQRVNALRTHKGMIVSIWQGTQPDTPWADKFPAPPPATMTEKEHEAADKSLLEEEKAVSDALDEAAQKAKERDQEKAEAHKLAMARATEIDKAIEAALGERHKLEERAQELSLDLSDVPGYDDDTNQPELAEGEYNAVKLRLENEKAAVKARLDLLNKQAKWGPGELTDIAGDAKNAFDSLKTTLHNLTDTLDNTAGTWIKALNTYAKVRNEAIAEEELRESMRAFYEDTNTGEKQPKPVNKVLMIAFAKEYEYDEKGWEKYKKLYQEIKKSELVQEAPSYNGMLLLTKLRSALPSGNTAGQWYTHDKEFKEGNVKYQYHLSVSFSVPATTNKRPAVATIRQAHVSFKSGKMDKKYWYNLRAGQFTFDNPSGGAPANGTMRDKADGVLRGAASKLNCQF